MRQLNTEYWSQSERQRALSPLSSVLCPLSQRGITLVTVALLLLLLGGALMAGVAYLRASLPADLAASQKDALLWADKAIQGFASIHHRLPCPAVTPDGDENCTLVKGWLPTKALDLDATMFAPGLLPMRYMVYSDTTTATGEDYTHRSLTMNDGEPRLLPLDAYDPYGWDDGYDEEDELKSPPPKDPTAFEGKDGDSHLGRFATRYDNDARNGLDMCETMRLIRVSFEDDKADKDFTEFAHYRRGTLTVNVAYGIAAPGQGSASGSIDRFEGANANDSPVMEAPDRAHDSNYDDYVFVRDLPSLMTAFGCRPVPYNVSDEYIANLASGDMGGLTGFVADIVEVASQLLGDLPLEELPIEYDRQGIVAPMPSSVQSVALAVNLVEEVESQYGSVKGSATQTMVFGIIESVLAGAGIALSAAQIVADGIGVAESIGIAVACIGLCANEYAAAALYVASIAVSGVSLVVNTAAMATLIAGTVQAGQVLFRLGGEDEADEMMETFCQKVGNPLPPELIEKFNESKELLVS